MDTKNWLEEQIKKAVEGIEHRPAWMKSAARFEGGAASQTQHKQSTKQSGALTEKSKR